MGYPSHLTDVARNGLRCNDKQADQIVSISRYGNFTKKKAVDKMRAEKEGI